MISALLFLIMCAIVFLGVCALVVLVITIGTEVDAPTKEDHERLNK